MSFSGGDLLSSIFGKLDESQTLSHFSQTAVTAWLKEACQVLNIERTLIGYYVFPAVAGQMNYPLPLNFIEANHLRWRGMPMEKRAPSEFPVITNTQSDSTIYTVVPYPQVSDANDPLPSGQQTLIVWPPSAYSGTGTPPIFPKTSDYFYSLWYYARIPTNFSGVSSDPNYIGNYTFQLPDEFMAILSNKTIAILALVDGEPEMAKLFEGMAQMLIDKYSELAKNLAINAPSQVRLVTGKFLQNSLAGGF